MKKRYFFALLQAACFLLISLLLQNCGGSSNLPLEGEQKPVEMIEQIKGQVSVVEANQEREQESSSLPTIMPELWQEIFSYLGFEGVLAARAVNSDWNQLITGYRKAGIVGIENKPCHIIDTRGWVKSKEIDFRDDKLSQIKPEAIPRFAFYHLMGHVNNLPQSWWPYLPATQVHTLYLKWNEIGAVGASELAKVLPATQVHTLRLGSNQIGAAGASELAKALPATQVHILDLGGNEIGVAGASELAKALPATQVHILDLGGNEIGATGATELAKALLGTQMYGLNLGYNQIGTAGARELAKALPATRVHTLYLGGNEIGAAGASEFAKALPATQVHTLSLSDNQIGDAGALELAKALPATRVHTLNLERNEIEDATQKLLVKQYPHIKWRF
jgi:hypothetical protein